MAFASYDFGSRNSVSKGTTVRAKGSCGIGCGVRVGNYAIGKFSVGPMNVGAKAAL